LALTWKLLDIIPEAEIPFPKAIFT
jgi:hypothetical protein